MDLKKRLKGFFTLSCKRSDGFTLVELIVVIAILAILGGVAVPAYSGYVKKANMQADISLISDIEHALTLAYYNQDLTDGTAGFIMLSPNEDGSMADEEGYTALAMEKTFGSSWEDAMQLKYDNWGVSWNTISYEDATNVVNSNFVQKYSPSELMEQVQTLIDTVNGTSEQVNVEIYSMYGYADENGESQNAIIDTMKAYGIGESKEDWDELSFEAKSNVLVLATASSISEGKNLHTVNSVIPSYALYTAYAKENAEFKIAYDNFKTELDTITKTTNADSQYEAIKKAYNKLETAAGNGFDEWRNTSTGEVNAEGNPITVGDSHMDAFKAVMAGVGNAMEDNGDSVLSQLDDPNMFTSGIGSEMYNDYLNSAYASAGTGVVDEFMAMQDMEEYKGMVLVQYVITNGILYIVNSMPVY